MSDEIETLNSPEEPTPSLVNTPETPEPTPEEPKPEEPKPETPPAEVIPLAAADLVVPEGFTVDEGLQTKFLDAINNADLSPKDRANALLALHTETIKTAREADSAAWSTMQKEWQDAAKADAEIGGEKLQPALTNIGKLLDEYGSPELRGVFDLTGSGNNPHMIRFLNKVAGVLTEGGHLGGKPSVGVSPEERALRMYPTMAK